MPSEIQTNDEGRVTSVVDAEVITDPEADLAVQIPDTETVNASDVDGFSVHDEPTPEEVFAGDSEPTIDADEVREADADSDDE